ncbi:flagellar filament capping protein FliD [Candidatus Poribacteria bacterium]|jgi:flagellar hook-associated protein 2|nr:flagellar filament capping protein FliD [Candidatus Poribacteria bacterium]MBT5532323.1 flagellar filament capping protein FliD [Candidatus Poribacteria bacterium]MBT5712242.1 flagellar filament capping protein FliD [Candidatus Poribacteria bacterium]MBT7098693.1 flagellar filament capping protein FliD [Candidatus Poribacteria bacterium]MBT7804853.1 flagellar filament capping protein FliD [Candidatus Poribacteria bacterium]
MAFQIFGIQSGLDTGNIIDQLIAIESRPLNLLQRREATLEQQKSLFQDYNTKLSTLKSALTTIGDDDTLDQVSATSSNEDALEVEGGTSGNLGSYSFTINSLAAQTIVIADTTIADATAANAFTAGDLGVTVNGTTETISYASTASLNDIRDAINNLTLDVSASIIDISGAGTDYRLVITGTQEGTTNAVTTSDTGSLRADLGIATADQSAANSSISLAGTTITRSSNTITDVIDGLTLTLKDATGTPTVAVQVVSNSSGNLSEIQTFLDAVNDVRQFAVDQTKFTEGATSQGALFGDRTLISTDSELRSLFTAQFSGLTTIQSMSQLGITLNTSTGLFEMDSSRVTEQLDDNPSAVQTFFESLKDSMTNVAGTLVLDGITDSIDGRIKTKTDFLQTEIEQLQESQERMEGRLEGRRALLERQFLIMEQTMAQMEAQQSSFASQLGGLAGQ